MIAELSPEESKMIADMKAAKTRVMLALIGTVDVNNADEMQRLSTDYLMLSMVYSQQAKNIRARVK